MEFNNGAELVDHILDIARRLGYVATSEPSSSGNFRRRGLGRSARGTRPMPDILVERGEKRVFVEVKLRPVLMSAVMQVHEYRNQLGAPTILCLPDSSFQATPQSVVEFARRNDVTLCPISQIEHALKQCLS